MEDGHFQPHVLEKAKRRVGTVLREKWRLDRLIGIGGMATVYAATHRTGNRVAIKMLHDAYAFDQTTTRRFLREGYAANTVAHPGTVRVLDDDTAEDGAVFIVMELLEGETFETRCERSGGRLPPVDVLSMMDQLLDVLAAAHAKTIVHRDIKPENIFVTHEGVVKLLDFGIAKLRTLHTGSVVTMVGTTVGTPRFMPPEQALGHDCIDARTDLWAVGAVMFWAMAGRHVHLAETLTGQLVAQATKHAPALGSVAPHVPSAVAAIVDRALAFEQDARWPDARAMQQAIRDTQAALGLPRNQPLPSLPPRGDSSPQIPSGMDPDPLTVGASGLSGADTADTIVQHPPSRRRTPMAIGIAAAALAIGVYLLVRGGPDDEHPPAGADAPTAQAQTEPAPAAPSVAPEAPPGATANPAAQPPDPAATPAPAESATPGAAPKKPPQPRSSARPQASAPASDEDWLNRQH